MYQKFFKRLIDIVCCLIALPFFLLILIVVAPAIKFTDGGPVFYNAPRRGKDGKVFNMYKFRSMRVNAPDIRNADGSTYNGADDPRVTKIGKILRETSLDETPQILNVLKGDMSIIGPRARLANEGVKFEDMSAVKRARHKVRPGITGYTQAYFRNSITADEKDAYDAHYAQNVTFMMDVKIIFKTVTSVLKRDNIYVSAEVKSEDASKEPIETK